jgi:hypothetical protein
MENYQLLINGPWINALPTITRITAQVVAVGKRIKVTLTSSSRATKYKQKAALLSNSPLL